MRWPWQKRPVEPRPIEGLSPDVQATLLAGLKAQVARLNGRIDEERHNAAMRLTKAGDHDTFARKDREAAAWHNGEARRLLGQHDALCITIAEMEGRE